jgi:hypothetical protein
MSTELNWMRLYRAMYLNRLKEVTREQRPSLDGTEKQDFFEDTHIPHFL